MRPLCRCCQVPALSGRPEDLEQQTHGNPCPSHVFTASSTGQKIAHRGGPRQRCGCRRSRLGCGMAARPGDRHTPWAAAAAAPLHTLREAGLAAPHTANGQNDAGKIAILPLQPFGHAPPACALGGAHLFGVLVGLCLRRGRRPCPPAKPFPVTAVLDSLRRRPDNECDALQHAPARQRQFVVRHTHSPRVVFALRRRHKPCQDASVDGAERDEHLRRGCTEHATPQ